MFVSVLEAMDSQLFHVFASIKFTAPSLQIISRHKPRRFFVDLCWLRNEHASRATLRRVPIGSRFDLCRHNPRQRCRSRRQHSGTRLPSPHFKPESSLPFSKHSARPIKPTRDTAGLVSLPMPVRFSSNPSPKQCSKSRPPPVPSRYKPARRQSSLFHGHHSFGAHTQRYGTTPLPTKNATTASPMFKQRGLPSWVFPVLALVVLMVFAVGYEVPALKAHAYDSTGFGIETEADISSATVAARPARSGLRRLEKETIELEPLNAEHDGEEWIDRVGRSRQQEGTENDEQLMQEEDRKIDPLDLEKEEEVADGARVALQDIDKDENSTSGRTRARRAPVRVVDASQRSCFVYDRPPRTGSTTVARALRACLGHQGYTQPLLQNRLNRRLLVERMLRLPGEKIGMFSKHFYMNGEDVRRMREECGTLFYVTSCRPMRERMWSAAKYQFSEGNVNSSLTEEMREEAVRKVKKDRKTEAMLEGYPYLGADERAMEVREGERLRPDYVIRSGSMKEDLGRLLRALDCGGSFDSKNVHKAEEERGPVLERVKIRMGDKTFDKLNQLAGEVNERGLEKAKAFV